MELLENLQKKIEQNEVSKGQPLEIVQHNDPTLRTKSVPYLGDIVSDPETKQLIADMIATMTAAGAVGLAAIQVGAPVRILVVQDDKREPYVAINPVIVEEDEEKVRMVEGCLSFPGLFLPVWRPSSVVVSCLDMEGEVVKIAADNLLGRAIIHEIDHLDGILFVDRIPKVMRQGVNKKMVVHQRQLASFHKRQAEKQAKFNKLLAKYQNKAEVQPKEVVTETQEK